MTDVADNAPDWIETLLGLGRSVEDITLWQTGLRTLLVYASVVVLVRLGSRRFLSKATPFDAVVAIMLGSIMSSAITGSTPFLTTVAAGATIVAAHGGIAFLTARTSFGALFKGENRLLIKDGKVQEEALRRSKLSANDLQQALREEGENPDPAKIKRAYLERDGSISVVPLPAEPRILETRVENGVQTIRIELGST